MSQRFAVVHESEADFQTATELADRVLIEAINWLEEDGLPPQREWVRQAPLGNSLTWKAIPKLARAIGIKAHGHFNGEPGMADAAAARRAILYVKEVAPDLNAIVLIRDQDDQPDRKEGLDQARNEHHGPTAIVIGLAVVEREAWVISGFEPHNPDEDTRLNAARQELGFDPRLQSQSLTACKSDEARRSPKRVLKQLSGDDRARERHCWTNATLAQLRERGGENGLAAFLGEVKDRLAPLIGHVPQE